MWKVVSYRPESGHYNVMGLLEHDSAMIALREMFKDGIADELNFVLFSTSGVHGTYNTIESAEKYLNGDDGENGEVTFVIVHPRLVSMRYGVCNPRNQADIDFLKKLRESSWKALLDIGRPNA